ncbi:hypothetical protein GCM10011346_16450 [Oceanobacillus neutriphilus]|uniref:Uncharacterized protein n=1 Tax=Oceanobacillus neutriphilus TaxID=531815 RepID=A0ABQ2NS87_9BACI|nr:hypothetical protein GCM10011346_16450 [Oceanobacillus neutriphilus]
MTPGVAITHPIEKRCHNACTCTSWDWDYGYSSHRRAFAITRPIENICASQGELKIHLKSGFLFKLAEAVPMESGVVGRSGAVHNLHFNKKETKCKQDNGEHAYPGMISYRCLFPGAKVE